ncbi:MAG: DUF2062 domain-containing protein [Candidatus Omnitrophota bacterium]
MPKFLKTLWEKLFLINDTPQKISLGLGLGVFSGIFPGSGPVAAIFLALTFRANRAAALIGCLLTNTWLSFVSFLLALKIGAFIFGVSWSVIYQDWIVFTKGFRWQNLFKLSVLEIILPVLSGYMAIAFICGVITYLTSLIIINVFKKNHKKKS